MAKLIFLGTGPAGGIHKEGLPTRLETSTLLKTKKGNLLIDVTRDFLKQSRRIDKIDAILVTHGHSDAIGGISKLGRWQRKRGIKKLALYTAATTIQIIKKRFRDTNHLVFHKVSSHKKFTILGLTITPFSVEHSMQEGFPTFGYFIAFRNGTSFAYVSDVGKWDKKAQRFMEKAKILVLDGAMWGKKILSHLDVREVLPKICRWKNERIIFTQIGKTAPPQQILEEEIREICPKALPAFDGMRITF